MAALSIQVPMVYRKSRFICLDFVEIDILGVTSNHGKRTAYTSLRIAKELGLKGEELHDIAALTILHDKSKYTQRHSRDLSGKAFVMADYYEMCNEEKIKLIIAADLP